MDWKKTKYQPYGHQLLVPKDYESKRRVKMLKTILKAILLPYITEYFDKITTKFNKWVKKIMQK